MSSLPTQLDVILLAMITVGFVSLIMLIYYMYTHMGGASK